MSVIGSMIANLKAKTAVFDKKMGGSRRHIKGMKSDFSGLRSTLLKVTSAFAAFVGVRALVNLTRRTFESADAIGKLSDRIGVATEDIITFRHAAVLTGGSIEIMDKSLETFVRRLGEASKLGIGEAIDGIELLGLTIQEVEKLSPGEAFVEIAERISQMTDVTEKAVTAYKIFGRQGITLVNTLNIGRKGFKEARAEAERLGITMSRLEIARIEAANDAMFRLKQLLTGVAQQFAIKIAPLVVAISNKLIDMGVEGQIAFNDILFGAEKVANVFSFIGKIGSTIKIIWLGLKIAIGTILQTLTDGVIGLIGVLNTAIRTSNELFGTNFGQIDTTFLDALSQGLGEGLQKDLDNVTDLILNFDKSGQKVQDFFDELRDRIDLAAVNIRELITGIGDIPDPNDAFGNKSTIVGTFNAALVGQLGFGRPLEMIAEFTEQTAKNTKKTANQQGAVFG